MVAAEAAEAVEAAEVVEADLAVVEEAAEAVAAVLGTVTAATGAEAVVDEEAAEGVTGHQDMSLTVGVTDPLPPGEAAVATEAETTTMRGTPMPDIPLLQREILMLATHQPSATPTPDTAESVTPTQLLQPVTPTQDHLQIIMTATPTGEPQKNVILTTDGPLLPPNDPQTRTPVTSKLHPPLGATPLVQGDTGPRTVPLPREATIKQRDSQDSLRPLDWCI